MALISTNQSIYPSNYLFIYLSPCQSISPSRNMSIYIYIYIYIMAGYQSAYFIIGISAYLPILLSAYLPPTPLDEILF